MTHDEFQKRFTCNPENAAQKSIYKHWFAVSWLALLFVALEIKKNDVNVWNNKPDSLMRNILIYIPIVILAIAGFYVTYIIDTL